MSSISVIGMTSAIFVATVATVFWLVGKMNDAGLVVQTGVVHGLPIPMKVRWLWLYQVWTMYALMITASTAALALAFFRIAEQHGSPTQSSVLVFTFIAITGSVANLLTGISAFLAYASILREANAD